MFDPIKRRAAVDRFGRKRGLEHCVEPTPARQNLRQLDFVDDPPRLVEDSSARHGDTERRRLDLDAGPGEHREQFGMCDDPGTAALQLCGGTLEHFDLEAAAREQNRSKQSGHRPADDHDLHLARPVWFIAASPLARRATPSGLASDGRSVGATAQFGKGRLGQGERRIGAVEELDGDEHQLGVADIGQIMHHRFARRVG